MPAFTSRLKPSVVKPTMTSYTRLFSPATPRDKRFTKGVKLSPRSSDRSVKGNLENNENGKRWFKNWTWFRGPFSGKRSPSLDSSLPQSIIIRPPTAPPPTPVSLIALPSAYTASSLNDQRVDPGATTAACSPPANSTLPPLSRGRSTDHKVFTTERVLAAQNPFISIPSTSPKPYRVKRKPVPTTPADLLDDPDTLIHTSIVENSVIRTRNPFSDPPTSLANAGIASDSAPAGVGFSQPHALDVSNIPTPPEDTSGQSGASPITRSCLRVLADDATNRFALYWPPEHSYQPLSHTISRLADGSLSTSRIENERTVKIAIRKPVVAGDVMPRVPGHYLKGVDWSQDKSELRSLMAEKNTHI